MDHRSELQSYPSLLLWKLLQPISTCFCPRAAEFCIDSECHMYTQQPHTHTHTFITLTMHKANLPHPDPPLVLASLPPPEGQRKTSRSKFKPSQVAAQPPHYRPAVLRGDRDRAHLSIRFILLLSFSLLVLTFGDDIIGLGAKHLTCKQREETGAERNRCCLIPPALVSAVLSSGEGALAAYSLTHPRT